MDEVGSEKLYDERRYDIGNKDNALGYVGSKKVKGSAEDDNIKHIVDETYTILVFYA